MPTSDQREGKPHSKVLIVDDMAVNRMILASLLSSHGIEADMAASGQECLRLCRQTDYDLILLDHRMPEMDGVETFLQLKSLFADRGHAVPIVCHTTEDAQSNTSLYKAAGFADVLFKPIQPRRMSEILMTYLPEDVSTESTQEEQRILSEIAALPDWLQAAAGLDLRSGIAHCETAEDYLDAFAVFVQSADTKADEIEQYATQQDWKMYTMRVHSLKSVSRLIGATSLSDLAATLEDAGKRMDVYTIENHTGELLHSYRGFAALSAHLGAAPDEATTGRERDSILFVDGDAGFIPKTLTEKLREADFIVHCIKGELDAISRSISLARTILYYLPGDHSTMQQTLAILFELCRTKHRTLCVSGEPAQVEEARRLDTKHQIHEAYCRPIDTNRMVQQMRDIADSYAEYDRRKTLLVIDDDRDFLRIISRWLQSSYEVVTESSGAAALQYLTTGRPDLILLDYEMPDQDGYEILDRIRRNPRTARIPVVFLTGLNDKDSVLRILKRKPDGYFLKSTGKDELLDALDRFFAESARGY